MRRAILVLLVAVTLAPAASAFSGPRTYSGQTVDLVLKKNKDVIKSAGFVPPPGGFPLQCAEGATKEENPFGFLQRPKLKNRKFQLAATTTFVFQTIDESGSVVNTEKAPLRVSVHGRFKRNFKRVSGTVTMSGSYYAPSPGPNNSDVQYHDCKGRAPWTAQLGFGGGP